MEQQSLHNLGAINLFLFLPHSFLLTCMYDPVIVQNMYFIAENSPGFGCQVRQTHIGNKGYKVFSFVSSHSPLTFPAVFMF